MKHTTAGALALGLLAHGVAAQAQGTTDIVVTATKKATGEDPGNVPIAVTVLAGDAIDHGAPFRDLQSLSYRVPGASLDGVGTFRGVANFAMRGLGINSSIPSIDPAVGTVIDGVHIAANSGVLLDSFDVAAIEVLRGPQGVLFGRNTTAGAVIVRTADPEFDWGGEARISAEGPIDGGRGAMRGTARAVLTGPLIADRLAIRLGVYHDSDGGWFRNLHDGGNIGGAETTLVRGGLTGKAGRATLTVKGEYLRLRGDGAPGQNHGLFSRKSYRVSLDNPGHIRGRAGFVSARLEAQIGPGTLTNVFGWRDYRHATSNDIDSTPQFLFHSNTGLRQRQWSNELRYAVSLPAFDLTGGFYWLDQAVAYAEDRSFSATATVRPYGGGTQDQRALGLFTQADWRLTGALTLSAGLRWSDERKLAAITYVRNRPTCWVLDGTCPVTGTNPLIPGENNGFTDRHSWSSLSPRLALSSRFGDNALGWASWTRGTRSGGYNLRITQPAAFEQIAAANGTPAFGPERVDSFELGIKWQGGDLASVNLAVYQNDVNGMQREINVPSASSGLAQYVYNTADARIRGAELEAELRPAQGLTLSSSVGLIDARYTRVLFDLNSDNRIDDADLALKPPRAPKWTWSLGANYSVALGSAARLVADARFAHRSRAAWTDNNWGYNAAADMLDASLSIDLGAPAITLTLYGRNLLDTVQFGGDTQLPFGAGPYSDGNNRPFDPHPAVGSFSPLFRGRTLGLEARFAM